MPVSFRRRRRVEQVESDGEEEPRSVDQPVERRSSSAQTKTRLQRRPPQKSAGDRSTKDAGPPARGRRRSALAMAERSKMKKSRSRPSVDGATSARAQRETRHATQRPRPPHELPAVSVEVSSKRGLARVDGDAHGVARSRRRVVNSTRPPKDWPLRPGKSSSSATDLTSLPPDAAGG